MAQVVDRLAEITAFRDRDMVDATLVSALRELLQCEEVAIYRSVGDAGERRWLTRARLSGAGGVATGDPPWTELESLPLLSDFPLRLQALVQQSPVARPGPPCVQVFPLEGDADEGAVLEVCNDSALDANATRLVHGVLRIYRNFQAVLDDSERDSLTGLLNRKTFDETFYKSAADSGRLTLPDQEAAGSGAPDGTERRAAVQPAFIAVIDIDHFKQVNDRFGHLIGDEVLLLLSRLMRSVFRFHDRLFRFGGEEFVVLLRCGGDAQAGIALDRLRNAVKGFEFPQVGTISVSIGYTELRAGDTPARAFERADRAVYWAKAHGRDQVCSHATLVAQGSIEDEAQVLGDVELF